MKKLSGVALVSIISISLIFGVSPAFAQTEENNKEEVAVSREDVSDNQTATFTKEKVDVSTEGVSENQTVTKEEANEDQTTPQILPVSTGLMEEYNRLVKMLEEAERKNDKELIEALLKKIQVIKEEIRGTTEEISGTAEESTKPQLVTEKPIRVVPREVTAVSPVIIDKCDELKAWEIKRARYEAIYALSDEELKDKGYRGGKEEVRKIIAELDEGIKRLRIECEPAVTTGTASGVTAPTRTLEPAIVAITAATPRPVAVESGVEITNYYSRRIAEIATGEVEIEEQLAVLKELRNEIDRLIEELIKSKDTISTEEVRGLVTKIEVRPGEIKMDEAIVKTIAKSVLTRVNNRDLEIKPTRTGVILQDGTIQVKVAELSIGIDKDEISRFEVLRVGNSEVKLMPSVVIEKLQIEPREIELKEENAIAVYKIKTAESRKLFGFIPVMIERILTVDASGTEANVIEEKRPWWAFLTTK